MKSSQSRKNPAKTNKYQDTFFNKFARGISPAPNLSEPVLWFQELHLVRCLGNGDKEENTIRKYKFKRGLNILWAEPEDPETSGGMYSDGFAGHSSGKTLFCRILRHLLGEPNFGTDELKEHVGEAFSELWAVASLRVAGRTWIVGRSLAGLAPAEAFALPDGEIVSVYQRIPEFCGYEQLTQTLEIECAAPLRHIYPTEAWRHLIPWLARDQEARFSSITAWRESISKADNPRTNVSMQHLLLRSMLRLLEQKEYEIRNLSDSLGDQISIWEKELSIKQTFVDQYLRNLAKTLKRIPEIEFDLLDLPKARNRINSHLTIREESIEYYRGKPDSAEVLSARKAVQDASTTKSLAEKRIQILTEEIPIEKENRDKSLLLIERIKKSGCRDPKRIEDKFCPNSYFTAIKNECVPHLGKADELSMFEIAELENVAQKMSKQIEAKEDEKALLQSDLDQFDAALKDKERALTDALKNEPNPLVSIQKDISNLQTAELQIDEAIRSSNELNNVYKNLEDAKDKRANLKSDLISFKLESEKRMMVFSDIFADVVRAVLGANVTASVVLGESGIQLRIKRLQELGGAAMETIKTLAFDIAAIVHSIEGKGDHPRFLIHDGPREADMARVVYERFFEYARLLEGAFQPEKCTFQYILTTTTHPPSDMREGSEWLLGEILSAKNKQGRLLKEDF